MTSRTLVAGIGNIFLSDDGFGVAVAGRLAGVGLPAGVSVVDYGIRGMHLAYDLASGFETAILVDAAPRGGAPGTVYVIEPDFAAAGQAQAAQAAAGASPLMDAHGMEPDVVLGMLDTLGGGRPARILVVGCEPASVDYGMGLSEPVEAAVEEAVRIVLDLVGGELPAAARADRAARGGPEPGDRAGLEMEEWTHVPRHSR